MRWFPLYWGLSVFIAVLICLGEIIAFGLAMTLEMLQYLVIHVSTRYRAISSRPDILLRLHQ